MINENSGLIRIHMTIMDLCNHAYISQLLNIYIYIYMYIYCVSPNLPLQVSRVLCSNLTKILYARENEICWAFPFFFFFFDKKGLSFSVVNISSNESGPNTHNFNPSKTGPSFNLNRPSPKYHFKGCVL